MPWKDVLVQRARTTHVPTVCAGCMGNAWGAARGDIADLIELTRLRADETRQLRAATEAREADAVALSGETTAAASTGSSNLMPKYETSFLRHFSGCRS
jgi:hypothetical protein